MNLPSIFSIVQGWVKLKGVSGLFAQVETLFSKNRVLVDALLNYGFNHRNHYLLDMNVANGGVARLAVITDAAWVTVYEYTGSGGLFGFNISTETADNWLIRLIVDGTDRFIGSGGLPSNDVTGDALYDLDNSGKNMDEIFRAVGIYYGSHDIFKYASPEGAPNVFTSSIKIQLKRVTGEASKKFRAGIISIAKD